MIVFELTMPHRGSWNNKWSGDSSSHVIVRHDTESLKNLVGKTYKHRWDDGWEAEISVRHYKSTDPEYRKLIKNNAGFCGYSWMVDNIIKFGGLNIPECEE